MLIAKGNMMQVSTERGRLFVLLVIFGAVVLAVFAIRQLELGHQDAGLYLSKERAVYWNGRNDTGERVASGIYFYQLQVGNFRATRKLAIVK